MVLRSEFSMDNYDEVKIEGKERAAKRSHIVMANGDHPVTVVESESDGEYDEMFDKMAVIENEENEANLKENEVKRSKTKKVKSQRDQVSQI